ncbi:MAG: AAA family ATPase [candidate division Zixibacteria bacterium]|nr:AAA family ATPase [candidate division Zixibacteria bacterium]
MLKDYSEPEQAMSVLSKLIFDVVKNNAPEKGAEFLGNGFLLKILSSYYPDYYFPINSEKNIEYALQLFGESTSGLSVFEKNKKLNEIYKSKKREYDKDISPFDFMRFLYDNFNLKEGDKITENEMVIAEGESAFIQFHPSYNYEDFVRGIVAETEEGEVRYNVHNKILAEFAEKAIDNPKGNYVLIIDEINRANLSSVLGELIYALEYRGEIVESMYEYEGSRELTLPQNLYVIGTMNTADRSVGNIDYAIRRRFAFIDMPSKIEVLQNFDSYDTENTRKYAISLYENVEKLFKEEFLSPDFHKEDVMIGHSYFLAKNVQELSMKLEYEIKPILKEYVKDGVLYGEKIINLINVLQG